jgi:hypothetical protein
MNSQPRIRFVVPAAAAILLTFGRGVLLPFLSLNTWVDKSLNIFVVVIAPLFALKDIYSHLLSHNIYLRLMFFLLVLWVSFVILLGSSIEYWPNNSELITLGLIILIVSQISRFELRRVRRIILLLAGVFTVYAIIYSWSTIQLIVSGKLKTRLGIEISSAIVVAYPRVMYTIILTCLFSLVAEKGFWLKIYSAVTMILPIIIALATGGRGPMVGFLAGAFVLAGGYRTNKKTFYPFLTIIGLITICYFAIETYFPVMENRISEGSDSGRSVIWTYVLGRDITWFGRGIWGEYPHNIFLEFYDTYGVLGLILFLVFFVTLVRSIVRCYIKTHHDEVLWAISLFVLAIIAQQFSLSIIYCGLWAAIMLQVGYSWDCSSAHSAGIVSYSEAGRNSMTTWIKRNRHGYQNNFRGNKP